MKVNMVPVDLTLLKLVPIEIYTLILTSLTYKKLYHLAKSKAYIVHCSEQFCFEQRNEFSRCVLKLFKLYNI